jgi:cysteine synthase
LVAINEAREMGKDDVVVTVLPDSADRYVYRGEQHFVT